MSLLLPPSRIWKTKHLDCACSHPERGGNSGHNDTGNCKRLVGELI